MTGYRDKAGFDPWQPRQYGPAARPFNWVQWTGVGIGVIGALLFAAYVLGRFGLIPQFTDDATPVAMLLPIGAMLVNSRRQPSTCDPQTLERRRRIALWVAAAVLVLGLVLAAILISLSKGA